jgi:hypothetical protein
MNTRSDASGAAVTTLTLNCSAVGAAAPTPGAIARALHAAFGVPGESLRAIEPGDRGVFELVLEAARAHDIETPATLVMLLPDGRGALLGTLARPTDPLELQGSVWRLEGAEAVPTPGSVALALAALGLGGEELGFLTPEGATLRLVLPPAADLFPDAAAVVVADCPLTLRRA